jgi:hypothetical protein
MFLIQSLPFLRELKNEYKINIISIEEGSTGHFESEKFQQQYSELNQKYNLVILKSRNLLFLPKIINNIIQLIPQLFLRSKKENLEYYHARGYLPAIVLHYLKRFLPVKYIFDMRGVYIDELKLLQNMSENNIRIRLWRHLEKKAIESSELAVVVSKPFADYVKKIDPEVNIYIIKNSIVKKIIREEEYRTIRNEYRTKLGIENKKVWIYSGSGYKWQLIPQMISLFKIASEIDRDIHFLMICRDKTDEIDHIFKEFNVSDELFTIISVTAEEVNKYLIAGDIGILLRENSVINEVSDPLKFVEYLHAGLLVVISKYIGDTEEIVIKHELGLVLDSFEESNFRKYLDSLNKMLINRNPIKIINTAKTIYDFDKSLGLYRDCYQKLMS